MEEEGLSVVLSPTQLALALSGQEVAEGETSSNRFWGGVKAAAGAVELIGAGALLLAPEPTMATKAGGVILGAHGLDTVQSGVRQLWTGEETVSFTHAGGRELAIALGADPETADRIGFGIDLAVPIAVSLGVGAARAIAIRSGRIALAAEEAAAGSRVGGHTIAKHIGKTEAELRARLIAEPRIPAATTFRSLDVAERALYQALRSNRAAIEAWARTARPGARQAFEYTAREVVGQGVVRSTGMVQTMTRLRFVLKMQAYNGKPYYILTSFPIP